MADVEYTTIFNSIQEENFKKFYKNIGNICDNKPALAYTLNKSLKTWPVRGCDFK